MTLTDKQDYLRRVYYRAVNKGIIERQQDFADALGIARTSLSSAMNGAERALTKNLYEKVKMWAQLHGVDDEQQKEDSKPAGEHSKYPCSSRRPWRTLPPCYAYRPSRLQGMKPEVVTAGLTAWEVQKKI